MMVGADLILFFKMIPLGTSVLFLQPWLAGALALTYPLVVAALWRRRPRARILLLYTLNMTAVIAFLWFVAQWHLFQI
jgi:hypothetical protein